MYEGKKGMMFMGWHTCNGEAFICLAVTYHE